MRYWTKTKKINNVCAIHSQLVPPPLSFLPFRNPGEDTKMLVCDMCDKGYHTFCLQPAMDSLPTNGWRCKVGKDESLLHATAPELPPLRETVRYTSSREQIMFSNNSPRMILAASDQQYSHTILLWEYLHTRCHNTCQYHWPSLIHPALKRCLSFR